MNWQQLSASRQEAGDYAIQRVAHYYYELSHAKEGKLRKYRTPRGAQRAAKRHNASIKK